MIRMSAVTLKRFGIMSGIVVVLMLSAGCTNSNDQTSSKPEEKPQILEQDNNHSDELGSEFDPPSIDFIDDVDSMPESDKGISISSPDGTKQINQKEIEKYNIDAPFNVNKLTLMGFSIGERREVVQQKFGLPHYEYSMDDGEDPILVYEYPGFSIGFDQSSRIIFIEVNSSVINPGLNGLRIGDLVSDAIDAIGRADSATDYVLNYENDNRNLKMDIDPESKTIRSIKLF